MDRPAQDHPHTAPRSLPAWIRFLWSRVLFFGRSSDDISWRWPALFVLLVLPGLLLYPCLSFYLFEPDEGRYAEIPREMLQRGEWVVPYLHGQPYLDKPPLLYWLVMASYALCGVHDWAARLVPALAVHACVLLTYLLGRRSLGERAAFWGALLLTLAPGFLGMGRLLLLDGILALWVTVGVFAALEAVRAPRLHRGWWLLSAAACGLGVLTKGPVAVLLIVPPLWLHRRLTGTGAPIPWLSRVAWLGVVLAVAAPWYVAVCVRAPEFAGYFLWEHNVVRFFSPFDHLEPIWYYLPQLLGGLLPATLLLPPLLHFLGCGDPAAAARRTSGLGFAVLAGGWCVLFFSVSGCKLPTYILPAYPALALVFGFFLAHTPWPRPRRTAAIIGIGVAVQFAADYLVVPWYAQYRSPLGQWEPLARLCADPDIPVICYPRSAHSVAFYLGREDLPSYRSKEIHLLCHKLKQQPRTVVLLTHRNSLRGLCHALPPELKVVERQHFGLTPVSWLPRDPAKQLAHVLGDTALGLCDLVVVEWRGPAQPPSAAR